MDGLGSGHRPHGGGDRRLEIVSGRSYGCSHTCTSRSGSPDLPPNPGNERGPWRLKDPEKERKKRVAKYKVYGVEGKVKARLRKGLRWIKNKCSQIVHGY